MVTKSILFIILLSTVYTLVLSKEFDHLNLNKDSIDNEKIYSYKFNDYDEDSILLKNKDGRIIDIKKNEFANGFTLIYLNTDKELIGFKTGNIRKGYKNGQWITFNTLYRNQISQIEFYKNNNLDVLYIFQPDGSLKHSIKFENGNNHKEPRKIINSDVIQPDFKPSPPSKIDLINSETNPDYIFLISNTQFFNNVYISDSGIFLYKKNKSPLTTNLRYKILNNQTLKGLIMGTFVDGYKYGEWIYYHKNFYENIVKIEHYDSGVLNGHYYVLDTSGTMLYQTEFKNGTGIYKDFYPESGRLMVSGQYENGDRTGDWTFYLENGEVCQIQTFSNNKLIKKTTGICPQYILDPFLYHTKKGNNITDISLPPLPTPPEIKEVKPINPSIWNP